MSIDELKVAYDKGILREAFGVGTAVVVIPFKSITDQDQTMQLNPEEFVVAPMLKAQLNGIKKGIVPDNHGWIQHVKSKEPVVA